MTLTLDRGPHESLSRGACAAALSVHRDDANATHLYAAWRQGALRAREAALVDLQGRQGL